MSPLSALVFISAATARNMLRRQIRRLREPRYLVATLFGLFYVFNVFVQPGLGAGRAARKAALGHLDASLAPFVEGGLAWFGMLFILVSWLFGGDEGGLSFSEAEIQFLFPAPLSRRQLVHYKLARSVLLSLFSAAVLTLGLGRRLAHSSLFFVAGAWVGVATLSLHVAAASLTRQSLLDHGVRGPVRRLLALVVPAAILGCLAAGLHLVPDAWPQRWADVQPFAAHLLATPPLTWASAPLLPAVHVALAKSPADLLRWAPAALLLLSVHYAWALSTDAAFEQASIAAAEKRARRVEGMRRGQLTIRQGARPPFALGATGNPAVAVYWKNLTAAVRLLSLRVVILILMPALTTAVSAVAFGSHLDRVLGAIGCAVVACWTALFGVQVYRIDFRLDLASMDLLKSWPLRGVDLAVAEVLAPFTVLAAVEWAFLLAAAVLAPSQFPFDVGHVSPLALAAAAAVALPALTLAALVVQNAAALLFPAWISSGASAPRGVEAIGQRLVTLLGTLVVLSVGLVPAAVVGGITAALLYRVLGGATLPVATVAGVIVVLVEVGAALVGLGAAFDRFDPGRP